MHVLEHLVDMDNFIDLASMDTPTLLGAQAGTAADFLSELGSPEHLLSEDAAGAARRAFAAATSAELSVAEKNAAILALKVPQAVKHLSGMLTQYDWDYVEQAKEIRGYVVAQLLEESKHPDAKIRLRALQMLGNLTEVGSFTERIEVTKKDASADEIEARIRSKLSALLPKVVEVETITSRPVQTHLSKD